MRHNYSPQLLTGPPAWRRPTSPPAWRRPTWCESLGRLAGVRRVSSESTSVVEATGLAQARSSVNVPQSAGGFTLVEIMIVLAMIAILSSIAMPSLRGFAASTRLKSSTHAIRDMLNFARDMAITERRGYLVVFDFDRNRYWLASSETFNTADVGGSLITNAANANNQVSSRQTDGRQATVSRTSMILGAPQELSSRVNLVLMTSNHNFQSSQVSSGSDYIYFSSTGSAEEAVLYVKDARGEAMSVTVEAAAGRVRIERLDRQEIQELGLTPQDDF